MDTITFDNHYNDIDFDGLFVTDSGYYSSGDGKYNIDITDFNGELCDKFNYTAICNFLYQSRRGSKTGWNGYIGGYSHSHHIVILVKDSKYMVVRYGTDDIPSTPFYSLFTLKSKIYSSLEEAWSSLNEHEQSAILKNTHK